MLSYYCCGCRASYPAQPKRCPRCKGRSFSAVSDDAPTRALLDADPPVVVENLDAELAEAFAASERFRLASISGKPVPEPPKAQSVKAALLDAAERLKGSGAVPPIVGPLVAGLLGDLGPLQRHAYEETKKLVEGDDAPPTPRDLPPR